MEPDTSCYKQICSLFGEQILAADQKIDRKKLGAIVFADQEKLAMLNAIVHPAVKEYIRTAVYLEKQKACVPFVVVEAALLLEEHYDEICDEIWYIYVDDAARRIRLKQSRGYSDRKIDDILKNQKKDRDANSKGTMLLLRVQLIEYHAKYTALGTIPSYAYQNYCEMYAAYHELGGNGMVTKMKQEIEELHIKRKGE